MKSLFLAVSAVTLGSFMIASAQENDMPDPVAEASLSAIGIGVSDLAVSNAFYTEVLGMKYLTRFELDYMDEIVLRFPGGGSAIVLMQWTDGSKRTLGSNGIKIVLRVPDPTATAQRIREAGYEIVREPEPSATVGGAVVGFARDPDGYLLEILPIG